MTRKTLIDQLSADVSGACVCDKMRRAARLITRRYNAALKPAGIKATQFTILAAVALREDATLTELSSILGMERTTFLRNLRPLEREGLVETRDEDSGRARKARLTAKGVRVMEKALPLWRGAQKSMKRTLGKETWARVHEELGSIGRAA